MSPVAGRLALAATACNLVGFGLATYLAYEHFTTKVFQGCVLGGGCQAVTTSSYSRVMGVPVVVPGLVYFVVSFFLHVPPAWRSSNTLVSRVRIGWSAVGMLSVFYLVYGELSVGAICMYCTGVHLMVFVLFAISLVGAAALDRTPDGLAEEIVR